MFLDIIILSPMIFLLILIKIVAVIYQKISEIISIWELVTDKSLISQTLAWTACKNDNVKN